MRRRRAFTLIELMIVVTILGIIVAWVIRASMGGIKQAEQKATLALIAKLEAAITDRMDALSTQHPEPTAAHYVLAQIYSKTFATPDNPAGTFNAPAAQRAQVIAQLDYLRGELPDVFVVQAGVSGNGQGVYPLNFGGAAFTSPAGGPNDYLLPLGAAGQYASNALSSDVNVQAQNTKIGITQQNAVPASFSPLGRLAPTGIYGAAWHVQAAIYSQLGYGPQGTDGADNNNDGYVDDLLEGLSHLSGADRPRALQDIATKLGNHDHKTARAEMLYAALVLSGGPLGSSFSPDDFNNQEVKDTDGDGLLEFVDAWGEPLQFYRWPILYRSDIQRGFPDLAKIAQDVANGAPAGPYVSVYESRDVDTFDPNQQLLSPSWWTAWNDGPSGWPGGAAQGPVGAAAMAFQQHFHTLADPLAILNGKPGYSSSRTDVNTFWDRSASALVGLSGLKVSYYPRRAYYSRPLILSGGSDKQPGVARLGVDYRELDDRSSFPLVDGSYASTRDGSGAPFPGPMPKGTIWTAAQINLLIQIENQGGQVDPNRTGPLAVPSFTGTYRNDTNTYLKDYAGSDDITTHNLNSLGGPVSQ